VLLPGQVGDDRRHPGRPEAGGEIVESERRDYRLEEVGVDEEEAILLPGSSHRPEL
jgi:hypothetical protein